MGTKSDSVYTEDEWLKTNCMYVCVCVDISIYICVHLLVDFGGFYIWHCKPLGVTSLCKELNGTFFVFTLSPFLGWSRKEQTLNPF